MGLENYRQMDRVNMSKKEFDPYRYIELLGSIWSGSDPKLSDYACNVFAHKLVVLDEIIGSLEDDNPLKGRLKELRDKLKKRGQAIWILNSDTLTNLAIKVKRRTQFVKWEDESKEETEETEEIE